MINESTDNALFNGQRTICPALPTNTDDRQTTYIVRVHAFTILGQQTPTTDYRQCDWTNAEKSHNLTY
jgi:hypothetical protein